MDYWGLAPEAKIIERGEKAARKRLTKFLNGPVSAYRHNATCKGSMRPQGFRNESAFRRWSEGNTGFPTVDAGMRELNTTGFMHNRFRMIVAMFLTKDLHIQWRVGEQYFMKKLVDGDIAANNGGWQWSAGTGADAAPYFRILNP